MGQAATDRLFRLVGGFTGLYALSVWILSQGGSVLSEIPGLDPRAPLTSQYHAALVVGFGLAVTALLAVAHMSAAGERPALLLPPLGLGDVRPQDAGAPSTLAHQAFVFLFCLLLPAASLVHFLRNVQAQGIVWNERLPAAASVPAGCALPPVLLWLGCPSQWRAEAAAERAAAARLGGRDWLANHWCDLLWERGVSGPQAAARAAGAGGEGGGAQDERLAWQQVQALPRPIANGVRDLVARRVPADLDGSPALCAGKRDRSEACVADARRCRGVQWGPWSPFVLFLPALLGWTSFAFACVTITRAWRNAGGAGPAAPASAAEPRPSGRPETPASGDSA